MVGVSRDGDLSFTERTLERCTGIATDKKSLYVTSNWQIWRFENALSTGERLEGFDAVYVPKASHVTGHINCQEMVVDGDGRLVFANTLFNCLSYLSRDYSFHPVWKPEFISTYEPKDRCHLNGLALRDGKPAYVTLGSCSDVENGWRDDHDDGGVIMDIQTNKVVCEGLSMPHSPRLDGKTLWVQNSGTGYLGRVDTKTKMFEPLTLCPGYLRGMAIIGNFAVVCISRIRDKHGFKDFQLAKNMKADNASDRCGVLVIDLTSGEILHWLRFDGGIKELFGVAIMSGVAQPRAVGFKTDEIARIVSLPPTAN